MVNFVKLWNSHPTVESFIDDFPCKKNGKKAFDNQCAIRIGVAFEKTGVNLKSFKGAKCWHSHKPAHILRAEEIENWLKGPFSPFKNITE
ncbi:MAG: type VI secretion system amidase effector protein Tae4 [Gammaproteobacteria bacterium]|nr:type VI secretion system amidase effector protein Tae4 [Gammaproteobacteria bacterium]MCF6260449.1 type VI secretion system amidase effector protein Tae4 [Gammaproteobacteria bacterium]